MLRTANFLKLVALCSLATPALSETVEQSNGGDVFVAGEAVSHSVAADRDVFAAGSSVTLKGQARGDVHASGFDVDVETQTAGDLYAAGGTVTVRSDVAEDLTMLGYSLRTSQSSATGGNARMMGRTITIDGPVDGALTAMGGEIILNAAITGDAWLVAEKITYGPDALIEGQLRYGSPDEITPPARVVPAERVTFERMTRADAIATAGEAWEWQEYPVLPAFINIFTGFLITLAFFLVVGAIFLTFLPKPVERLRLSIAHRPGMIFLIGVIGLSMLFGMVPITALTVFGLPFVPVVLLAIIVAWTLGYILAAYAVGMAVWIVFGAGEAPSTLGRLLVLAVAVTLITILNFIPFVGWIMNYTLVLIGVGAMTNMLFERMIGNHGPALDVDMQPIKD